MNTDFVVARAKEIQELEAKLARAKKELFAAIADKKKEANANGPKRMPLTKLIPNDILAEKKNKDGATSKQIVRQVLRKGYDSASQDFENVVYQTLRKLIRNGKVAELEVEEGKEPKYAHPKYVD